MAWSKGFFALYGSVAAVGLLGNAVICTAISRHALKRWIAMNERVLMGRGVDIAKFRK
ncbi:hypothetical protein RchiOBHm_Chr5g0007111 [Rosa chinensis]|uniref:Uncharacterized protein n=1 Tax=Rosa chinensis TaxID=74649 RepID=A0A2P6Q3R7_ROSCH|nr:hypothetical protein RchiOBHm_Chr5g0007111 [Rosa chinensis]